MHVEVRCVYRGTTGIETETDTVVERERERGKALQSTSQRKR